MQSRDFVGEKLPKARDPRKTVESEHVEVIEGTRPWSAQPTNSR